MIFSNDKRQLTVFLTGVEEFVAGLVAKMREIYNGGRIGCNDAQYFPGFHCF